MTVEAHLLSRDENRVRIFTINRPAARNAWSPELEESLSTQIALADGDPEVGAVVITGAGDHAFCAGADMKDPATHTTQGVEDFLAQRWLVTDPPWLRSLLDLRKPLIGAINGVAVGAGCSIAMACDILLAAPNADFRFPQAGYGIMPIHGGAARLAQWIGKGTAMELLLTGRPLTSAEAQARGLVNRVVGGDALLGEALSLASQIASKPPLGVLLTKESLKQGLDTEALRATSATDFYRYLALIQTDDSLTQHEAWRTERRARDEWV